MKYQCSEIEDLEKRDQSKIYQKVKEVSRIYISRNNIAIKKSSRPSQLSRSNAADMVSTKTTGVEPREAKIWTQREIAALSIDEYDRYEAEIDRAIEEGRVAR